MTSGTVLPLSRACQRSGAGLASPFVVMTGCAGEPETVTTRCAYWAASPGGLNRTMSPGRTWLTGIGLVMIAQPGP